QNCSTINLKEEGGIGMKINGQHTRGLRSMVCDSFTQINTGGTGVYLLNRGYAQLVSIFTVSTNVGILAERGGFCSITNSNSTFGNFGLVASGVSALLETSDVLYRTMRPTQTQNDFEVFSPGEGYREEEVIFLTNGTTVRVDEIEVVPGRFAPGTTIPVGPVTGFTVAPGFSEVGTVPADQLQFERNRQRGIPVLGIETIQQARTSERLNGGTGFNLTLTSDNVETFKQNMNPFPLPDDPNSFVDRPVVYPLFSRKFVMRFADTGARRPAFGDAVRFDIEYGGTVGELDSGSEVEILPTPSSPNTIYLFRDVSIFVTDVSRVRLSVTPAGETESIDVPPYAYRVAVRGPILNLELRADSYLAATGRALPVEGDEMRVTVARFYTVEESTEIVNIDVSEDGEPAMLQALCLVTLDLGITTAIPAAEPAVGAEYYQRSLITSSSHTFEYVGAGTNYLLAVPEEGGRPIRRNEIVQDNDLSGSVYFTSTDEKGDFRIGPDLVINRNTGTISGEAFERSLLTVVTPFILALE
ncbi:MAG: hypothetical protein ACRC16_26820, partial [Aeromonas salmonicida]